MTTGQDAQGGPEATRRALEAILGRARGALGEVPVAERADAERILELALAKLPPQGGQRELVGLIERLGRRSGAAVPFASLARALSARWAGDHAVALEALGLADEALMFRGY